MIKKGRRKKENTAGVQKELTIPFNPSLRLALGSSAAQVETQLWRVMPSFWDPHSETNWRRRHLKNTSYIKLNLSSSY